MGLGKEEGGTVERIWVQEGEEELHGSFPRTSRPRDSLVQPSHGRGMQAREGAALGRSWPPGFSTHGVGACWLWGRPLAPSFLLQHISRPHLSLRERASVNH